MKKLALAAVLILFVSLNATAIESVSTIIQSVVPEMLTISTDMVPTTNVDVFTADNSDLGSINIFSNRAGNWTITVTSTNGGMMKGVTAGNTNTYPYTLNFGTEENISLSTPFVVRMSGKTANQGLSYKLGISFQNFWNMATPISPDTYRDTLTITIAAS